MYDSCKSIIADGTFTASFREVLPSQCKDVDQGAWALVQDLKQRGMLDDTLVIWGGEFGRTIYSQGKLTATNYGRDHHPRCYSLWMAGGGAKPGIVHGETDEFSYNIVKDPVHIRDLQATMLHLMGIDNTRFTYNYQGLDQKLTGVEQAYVVKGIAGVMILNEQYQFGDVRYLITSNPEFKRGYDAGEAFSGFPERVLLERGTVLARLDFAIPQGFFNSPWWMKQEAMNKLIREAGPESSDIRREWQAPGSLA